jgi:hypothetical protein
MKPADFDFNANSKTFPRIMNASEVLNLSAFKKSERTSLKF